MWATKASTRGISIIINPEPSKAQDEAGVHKYSSFFELYRKPQPNLFLHVPSVLAGAENTGVEEISN